MSKPSGVVIIDYGSQYTQLIARRTREMGIYSIIIPGDAELAEVKALNPQAIILSGGPSSVYDEDAPTLPEGFLDYHTSQKIPVVGICYGMQLLVHNLGGSVVKGDVKEYGRMPVTLKNKGSIKLSEGTNVWMSHGDKIESLPVGFTLVAESQSGVPAAIEGPNKVYAFQFHPEVTHTEGGEELLSHLLKDLAGVKSDWNMTSAIEEQKAAIAAAVGEGEHVICALSGGVDSTVAATLVHQVLGDRLHCIFVDHGLNRYKERERVMDMFEQHLHLPVTCIDASDTFLSKLDGVEDPEKKRKIIGAEFINVFSDFATKLGKKGNKPKYLVQGTLYPDVIESSPPPQSLKDGIKGKKKKKSFAATIKSHHNVGGLPEDLDFQLIEPLRDLFKDEVRIMGKELGVPTEFLARHPFPGPGLAVRMPGPITRERIKILQNVDEIFIQSIRSAGIYDEIWQAFAVLLPVKSVGVQGDGRTHEAVAALRAVTSKDGMTADWYPFESTFLADVSNRICNEVEGVNRVVLDISSKPPATIEWE